MSRSWVYLSLHGRLTPKSFAKGFWVLFMIGLAVTQLTPTRRASGYAINHLAGLAYAVIAAWAWLALTVKRLHDSDRSSVLAVPAAVTLPVAYAATLASDRGLLDAIPFYLGGVAGIVLFCGWSALMWWVYRLPSSPGANSFGPAARDQSVIDAGHTSH